MWNCFKFVKTIIVLKMIAMLVNSLFNGGGGVGGGRGSLVYTVNITNWLPYPDIIHSVKFKLGLS